MLPPVPIDRHAPRAERARRRSAHSGLALALAVTLAATLGLTFSASPAYAANPVTPGNFRGLGFDQCEAPSQGAMSTWIAKSPFRAAGIYISGASRACQRQSNLNATWVGNQLAAGWRLMPITLGPQAACSTRYPRYGASTDPTINASTTNNYAAAQAQGRLEAQRAVTASRRLGIVAGSTIFYDLEAFDTRKSTACTQSALQFMHAWTNTLHDYRYASGFYSSAASGIRMLDDARVRSGNSITMPDQIWIADWDGKADTSSAYIRSDGWQPYSRAKQYRGDHSETWGGVRINIDRNYLDLRTPKLPGYGTTPTPTPTPAPAPKPTPAPAPAGLDYTGTSLADPRCNPASINRTAYRYTSAVRGSSSVIPLQCLLKQQRLYRHEVTGRWNTQTTTALQAFQRKVQHQVRVGVTRRDWVSLVVAGNSGTTLSARSRNADVTRVQRALNAAGSPGLAVTGAYDTATATAVGTYQRSVGIRDTGVVAAQTWSALRAGRR